MKPMMVHNKMIEPMMIRGKITLKGVPTEEAADAAEAEAEALSLATDVDELLD